MAKDHLIDLKRNKWDLTQPSKISHSIKFSQKEKYFDFVTLRILKSKKYQRNFLFLHNGNNAKIFSTVLTSEFTLIFPYRYTLVIKHIHF